MPAVLGLFPAALDAAKRGVSANRFYSELRELGIAPRRAEALDLFKSATSIVSRSAEEPFRPVNAIPSANEIGTWPTKKATGFAQTVALVYRDNTTGRQVTTWWRTTTETLLSRQDAIDAATLAYTPHESEYDQTLIGAAYTSTQRYEPIVGTQ